MQRRKQIIATIAAVAFAIAPAASLSAEHLTKLKDDFNGSFDYAWNFVNFEAENPFGQNGRAPQKGKQCGTDACASLEREQGARFLRIAVNSTTPEGEYTNTDVSEVELGLPTSESSGKWTPVLGKPVIMEADVRWNSVYNLDGTGGTGTSGVILWSSSVTDLNQGQDPTYDHIGFTWTDYRTIGGALAGLTANTAIDQNPFLTPILRPSSTLDIHDWVNLKLVWSVDAEGVQHTEFFVNGDSIGTQTLPVALHNLSAELWNDNQVVQFGPEGLTTEYPSPVSNQYFDINKITVKRHAL